MNWLSMERGTRRVVLHVSIAVSILVLALIGYSNAVRQARAFETPTPCDLSLFLRQARLFQQNGLIGGLDTAVRDSNSRYVIEKLKSLAPVNPHLVNMAVQHCHHYRYSTDQLSIVSPPGTGLTLSFFPEGQQARYAFITYTAIIFLALSAVALVAQAWTVPPIACALGAVCFLLMQWLSTAWSVPPSILLIFAAGYLTVRLFEDADSSGGTMWAMALGLVLGLSTNIRTANCLLAIGVGAGLGLLFLRGMRGHAVKLSALFAACFVIGCLPTLAANAINAGHPLTSTYASHNTQGLRLEWGTIAAGFEFYFIKHITIAAYGALSVAALAALWTMQRRLAVAAADRIAIVALVSLAASVAFFSAYEIRQPYYPGPPVAFAASVAAFLLIRSENARARARGTAVEAAAPFKLGVVLAAVAGVVAMFVSINVSVSRNYANPDIDFPLPARSVVWANNTIGSYDIYLNRQAGYLAVLDPESQDLVITSIAADNVPQFIANDTRSEETVERLKQRFDLRRVGRAFDADVYEIKVPPGRGKPF